MMFSSINLLGLPSVSGFLSKDLVIECFSHQGLGLLFSLILYANVVLTYCYTLNLVGLVSKPCGLGPYTSKIEMKTVSILVNISMGSVSVLFGAFYTQNFIPYTEMFVLSPSLKVLPLLAVGTMFLCMLMSNSQLSPKFTGSSLQLCLSKILYLSSAHLPISGMFLDILPSGIVRFNINPSLLLKGSAPIRPIVWGTMAPFVAMAMLV